MKYVAIFNQTKTFEVNPFDNSFFMQLRKHVVIKVFKKITSDSREHTHKKQESLGFQS